MASVSLPTRNVRFSLFLCLCFLGGGFALAHEDTDSTPPTIVDLAAGAGTFESLIAAVDAADLVDTLRSEGPWTVFAPSDEAFAALPKGTVESLLRPEAREDLTRILKAHVIAGSVDARAALSAGEAPTLAEVTWPIRLEGGQLFVGESRVVANDLRAQNGVVHVIDRVLIPAKPEPVVVSPTEAATRVLALAIERGVPLFNAGQEVGCVSVYEVAMRSLLERPAGLPDWFLEALEGGLVEAAQEHDASSAAWRLREGMDRALSLVALKDTLGEDEAPEWSRVANDERTTRLFDFDDRQSTREWFSLNDDVMGGISTSRIVLDRPGIARFEGALSLENNGGFATVRSRARDLDLDKADGLRLRVRGDGRTYRVSALASDRRMEVRVWQREFQTRRGEWQTITVPFNDLELNVMGRRFPDAGPLDPGAVRSISLGIADKNETPFELSVDWIEAFEARSPLTEGNGRTTVQKR